MWDFANSWCAREISAEMSSCAARAWAELPLPMRSETALISLWSSGGSSTVRPLGPRPFLISVPAPSPPSCGSPALLDPMLVFLLRLSRESSVCRWIPSGGFVDFGDKVILVEAQRYQPFQVADDLRDRKAPDAMQLYDLVWCISCCRVLDCDEAVQ